MNQYRHKTLWLDLETTGIDNRNCAIIQMAGFMETTGENGIKQVSDEFNIKIKPHEDASIEDGALKLLGFNKEDLYSEDRVSHNEAYKLISNMLKKHVSPFDKYDKAIIAGYNVKFDSDFLMNMFFRNNDKFYFSLFSSCNLDVLSKVAEARYLDKLDLHKCVNNKLSTLADHFGIKIDAHDAMSDIQSTKKIFDVLMIATGALPEINHWPSESTQSMEF